MGPVTALAGVCLHDVEGAHEGGKRLLASRLRPVSSKATHPPTYLPLHNAGGGSASHGQQLRIFGRNADGAMLLKPRRDQVSRTKSAGPRRRATALPCFPRFAINESGDKIQFR